MFKRLALLAITFALITTQSFAVTHNGLKAAFDEFSYSMEVEGAALDQEQKDVAIKALLVSIAELQAEGLSKQEIVDFAQSQIKDATLKANTKELFSQIQTEKMSEAESIELVRSLAKNFYAQGASWSGDTGMYVGLGGFLLLMIAVAVLVGPGKCANEAYARGNVGECVDSSYNGRYYNI